MANPMRVKANVKAVETFGEGVYRVTFAAERRYNKYLPGQFLHLTVDEFDPTTGYWPESRVFSIASEPRLDEVSIVYSVKGRYTRLMEQELHPGRQVWLKYPYGDFVIDEQALAKGPLVMVAGGTGVSPYIPFLLKAREPEGTIHLYYGVRRPEHLLFRDEFARLLQHQWFKLHLFVEEGLVLGLEQNPGRLSISQIQKDLGGQFDQGEYYLSGPPGMIKSFQKTLGEFNIESSRIHIDEWE